MNWIKQSKRTSEQIIAQSIGSLQTIKKDIDEALNYLEQNNLIEAKNKLATIGGVISVVIQRLQGKRE